MSKKVSVIVPVYRTKEWLNRCVESIAGQTYSNLEIILVDDGSPDECPKMCDSWAKKDGRIRVLHKENGGLMAAWMDGVRMSTGEYLCFVDSDDWIDDCMIEKMLEASSGCQREIICGNYVQEEEKRRFLVIQAMRPGIYTKEALKEEVFPKLLGQERRPITLSRCMKLTSRELIEENMHYCDPSIVMGEDVNIMLPALLSAERVVILEDACFYHYLYLKSSMVHRYDPGLYDNIRRLNEMSERVLKEKKAPQAEKQAQRELVLLLFLVMKNEVRSRQKGWLKRLKEVCAAKEMKEALCCSGVRIASKENRILYFAARYPNTVTLLGLKLLFTVFDWRR